MLIETQAYSFCHVPYNVLKQRFIIYLSSFRELHLAYSFFISWRMNSYKINYQTSRTVFSDETNALCIKWNHLKSGLKNWNCVLNSTAFAARGCSWRYTMAKCILQELNPYRKTLACLQNLLVDVFYSYYSCTERHSVLYKTLRDNMRCD